MKTRSSMSRPVPRCARWMVLLSILAGGMLSLVPDARAALVGNVLNARTSAADGAANVFYSNYVPMPATGVVDTVDIYYQGSSYAPFTMYQLRPTATAGQYEVKYSSGPITPSGTANSVLKIPLAKGGAYVRPGDIFAHYGRGIPYSDTPSGLNITNPQMIYFPSNTAPAVNTTISLPSAAFPSSSYVRDYASAVNHEWYVGNELTPRSAAADGSTGVFYTNFVPMPSHGIVDRVGIYYQGNNLTFNLYQLRPTGTANQYSVIYDSGTITPSGTINSILSLPLPNGSTTVLPGDLFAHYGRGIPYSSVGQTNFLNGHAIYYNSLNAPIAGNLITLGSAAFPLSGYVRDYAWSVHLMVPEPGSVSLLLLGALGLLAFSRRNLLALGNTWLRTAATRKA